MKVLCIDSTGLDLRSPYAVREGVTYQVLKSDLTDLLQVPALIQSYLIFEEEGETRHYFSKNRFVPVGDVDETELSKQRKATA